ncbi:hypothetical protein SAMN05421767_1464 [Granulicatella balaenopterae]|uniref:Uncharacterized protein n=2 Tax=Granulicatella balaenopterae TaxID=137733 RepID=A0A1H9NTV9_9LACT|nr:hypothetical protein SAMN05421767_1464 [Granulicatella balaenopterae]
MKKIQSNKLNELAKIYNESGKTALFQYIRDNDLVKHPYALLKRMKERSSLKYNVELDCFESVRDCDEDLFMSVEELCSPINNSSINQAQKDYSDKRNDIMEQLVHNLIGDRLLTIDKYVKIDSRLKEIFIDKTSMVLDGYEIKIY